MRQRAARDIPKTKGRIMGEKAIFQNAFPYGDDVLALPVADVESAASWYAQHFAMVEAERKSTPQPTVIMERDGVPYRVLG